MPKRIRLTLTALFARSTFERKLDAEISFHLETRTRELIAAGFSSREAARRARLEFGNPEATKDRCREFFGLQLFHQIRDDLRFTYRNLRKDVWLSAAVVLTLTLAISIAAGGFGWMEATFMRARIGDPSSFVRLYSTYTLDTEHPGRPGLTTLEEFESFRQNAKSIRDVVAWHRVTAPVGLDDTNENWMLLVTCNFFQLYRLAGIVAGLAPALESLKANLMDTLKASPAARTATGKRPWLHGLLIGGQIALSLMLLIAAALVARTEHDMLSGGPGYETRQILMVGLGLRDWHAIPQSWNSFQIRLAQNLQRLPGFESIAFTNTRPGYDDLDRVEIKIDAQTSHFVSVDEISPEYFSALGIPMVEGRGFSQTDLPCRRGPCNVIVSQEFVREYLPRGAIGTELRDAQGNRLEIVGVARDTSTAFHGHTDPPIIYEPWSPTQGLYAPLVRFAGDGAAASRAASAILRQNYPGAYVDVQTIQAWIDSNVEGFARTETLNLFISGLALVLAVIGLYGVVSFASGQRRKEYGLRIALGASRFDIYKAVLRANARPVFVGLAVGEALAFAATLVAAKILARFTLSPRDPAIFLGVPVLLGTVAIAAMMVPAHHAADCEPLKVLREE